MEKNIERKDSINKIMKEELEIKENNLQQSKLDVLKNEELSIEDYYIEVYEEEEIIEEPSQILKEKDYDPKPTKIFIKEHFEKNEIDHEINEKHKKKKYACKYPECNKRFAKPCLLQRHICLHTGERPYKCNFKNCDKVYSNISYLNRHKKIQHERKKFHRCEHCGMDFSELLTLKRHIHRIHDNGLHMQKLDKPCEVCCLVFKTRKLLRAHMITAHDRNLYKCKFCIKTFAEPYILRRHLQSNIHREYSCTVCPSKFTLFNDFKNHIKQEHTVFYSSFTCDTCGKKCKRKRNLTAHLQSHIKTTFFTCTIDGCGRIYNFQRNLDAHIRNFHLGDNYECHWCPAKLCSRQNLKLHVDKYHENPVPRKSQPSQKNGKRSCDAEKPKTSSVSVLTGVILPPAVERENFCVVTTLDMKTVI